MQSTEPPPQRAQTEVNSEPESSDTDDDDDDEDENVGISLSILACKHLSSLLGPCAHTHFALLASSCICYSLDMLVDLQVLVIYNKFL